MDPSMYLHTRIRMVIGCSWVMCRGSKTQYSIQHIHIHILITICMYVYYYREMEEDYINIILDCITC